jgi:hypothetical protein
MPLLSTFANGSARGFGFAGVGLATAPTIGVATATSNTTASVAWSAPISDGGSPIISYTIVPSSGATTTISSTGAPSYVQGVSGLSQSTNYQFQVYATNALGNGPLSGYSNLISTYGVPGAPGGVSASLSGNTSAQITYNAAYDGGSPITSYTAVSSPGGLTGTAGNLQPITVSGLATSTTYQFRVYATNAYGAGSLSGFSNSITTPSQLMVNVNPSSGLVNIPIQYASITSQGNFTVSQAAGTGTVTIQEIARPTGGSTSISPTSFFLGQGGSQGVTVYCTSPAGFFSNPIYGYNFAVLYGYDPYPTYFFTQNRV